MNLVSFREVFDPLLAQMLAHRAEKATALSADSLVLELVTHAQKLASAGKRLRPYLAYLGYRAAGGAYDNRIAHIGVGLELFHTFALVHDDIMDGDTERRGVQTLHEFARTRLENNARLGDGMGILVGDLLFQWARELLPDSDLSPYLSSMIDEVIVGQILDVKLAAHGKEVTRAELDEMLLLKTASYSFIRPMQIGAAAHKITPELESFFLEFGKALGFAFQLQDDYFDREGDAAQDRPSYYTRGFTDEGLAAMNEGFDLAEKVLTSAPLASDVSVLFRDLLIGVRTRKG